MKKAFLIVGILFVATGFGYSQNQPPKGPRGEDMIKQATKELSLTEDQVKQWKVIHKKYPMPDDRQKAEENRKKMGKELEATLTEEQIKKFQEMREKQGPPRQN